MMPCHCMETMQPTVYSACSWDHVDGPCMALHARGSTGPGGVCSSDHVQAPRMSWHCKARQCPHVPSAGTLVPSALVRVQDYEVVVLLGAGLWKLVLNLSASARRTTRWWCWWARASASRPSPRCWRTW
jgi:hypothetical protein